ncbi:MAG: polyphosphate polymerase domain-containing protein [Candidatus Gracilibacteria bacterium]|nr:polyphosphate polymerase domain-containing protein [Candidatus Gracilibacteria bacterium]
MKSTYNTKLQDFEPISLSELNAKASFLKRIDKKFLLNADQFAEVLGELKNDFKVLEIKGKKIFSYDNIYMDSDEYLFYNQHQDKKNSRTKVRTRYYLDSNTAYFEYKQKVDGVTNKYRYEFPSEEHGFMTKGKKRFFEGVWQSIYNEDRAPKISPSIQTKYKRITLVKNDGSERLTIDFDIKTQDLRDKKSKEIDLKNLVIIESKSLNKECDSAKIMGKHNITEAKSCSKYSLGVVYSGIAKKYDTFIETMEKIKEIRLETVKNRKRIAKVKNTKKIKETTEENKSNFVKKELQISIVGEKNNPFITKALKV